MQEVGVLLKLQVMWSMTGAGEHLAGELLDKSQIMDMLPSLLWSPTQGVCMRTWR